ncbi:MAG: hypothetical protein DMF01_00920, partial [Verrucomicrobia bacterium]
MVRGVVHHRRDWADTSYGDTGAGLHLSLANTQRQGVFVTVEHIQCHRSAAVGSRGNAKSCQYLAFVKRDAGPRIATCEWVRRSARAKRTAGSERWRWSYCRRRGWCRGWCICGSRSWCICG